MNADSLMHETLAPWILENLNIAVLLFDERLRLQYINPAGEMMFAASVRNLKGQQAADFTNLLRVTVKTNKGENMLAGTVFGKKEPRLVRLNSFRLEALPAGPMLLVYNKDVPGVIGALGTTLGENGVNISRMTVGREEASDQNVILLNTDTVVDKELLAKVTGLVDIDDAMVLELPTYNG